jgi:hypothetical protein
VDSLQGDMAMIDEHIIAETCEWLKEVMREGDEDMVEKLIGRISLDRSTVCSPQYQEFKRRQELRNNLVLMTGGKE